MSTETELALSSITDEELHEATRYLNAMLDAWSGEHAKTGFSTDGPWFALKALELALLRESAARHGADPWYAGMDLDGHPAARLLRYFAARLALNPDRRKSPRLNPAGELVARCLHCRREKLLTSEYFERGERLWSLVCRDCVGVDPDRLRALVLDDEDQYISTKVDDIADLVFEELS